MRLKYGRRTGHARREALDLQLGVEEHRGDLGALQQVLQIAIDVIQLVDLGAGHEGMGDSGPDGIRRLEAIAGERQEGAQRSRQTRQTTYAGK